MDQPKPEGPCSHKWEEVSRTYRPGVVQQIGMPKDYTIEARLGPKFIYGFTTIEMRCTKCGELQFNEVVGDQKQVDEYLASSVASYHTAGFITETHRTDETMVKMVKDDDDDGD